MTKRAMNQASEWVQRVLTAPAAAARSNAAAPAAKAAARPAAAPQPEQDLPPVPVATVAAAVPAGRPVRVIRVQSKRRRSGPLSRAAAALALALGLALLPARASAAPTQEDVFRSIQHNVSGGGGATEAGAGEGSGLLTFVIALGGLVSLLAFVGQTRKKQVAARPRAVAVPRALNHQGRLLREVLRAVPMRGREVRQLKAMADHATADRPLASPLTLLLCPSVMARTIQSKRLKVDRKALAAVARRAGLEVVGGKR